MAHNRLWRRHGRVRDNPHGCSGRSCLREGYPDVRGIQMSEGEPSCRIVGGIEVDPGFKRPHTVMLTGGVGGISHQEAQVAHRTVTKA